MKISSSSYDYLLILKDNDSADLKKELNLYLPFLKEKIWASKEKDLAFTKISDRIVDFYVKTELEVYQYNYQQLQITG